jgi:hypothetical protein
MIKQLSILVVAMGLMATAAQAKNEAPAAPDCEKQAAEKKLAGAAKNSFIKKCAGDTAAPAAAATAKPSPAEACEKQAAEKKLAGAAKNSFVKKCVTDAK